MDDCPTCHQSLENLSRSQLVILFFDYAVKGKQNDSDKIAEILLSSPKLTQMIKEMI